MENQICVDLYTEKTYYWMTQYPLKKITGAKWTYYTITTDRNNLKQIIKYASKYHIKYKCYGKHANSGLLRPVLRSKTAVMRS